MNIGQIRIIPRKNEFNMIGLASILIDGWLILKGIGVHKKNDGGYRLTYPKKGAEVIYHPINKEASKQIEAAIFSHLENWSDLV